MSCVLVVRIRIKPGNVDRFMSLLAANAAAARAEPGCLQFDVLVDPQDRSSIMLYEIYRDEAAFQAHQASQSFKDYLEHAVPLLAERVRTFYTRIAP